MMRRFLGAVQFLTVVPIHGETASLSESALFFPLVGAILGAGTGALIVLASNVFSKFVASFLGLAFLISLTGCLHEDGLADAADAFRSGRSREKILLIMKDSRIGSYGAIAIVLSVLLRWLSLADWKINPIYGMAASLSLSRTSLVILAGFTPAIGDGLGRIFASSLSRPIIIATLVQAALLSCIAGWRYALALWVASALVTVLARGQFLKRIGGVNGDCLGATCQAVETINMLILACRSCY